MTRLVRPGSLVALAVCAGMVAVAGCGGASPRPGPPVRLAVNAPATVHTGSATITGTVSPSVATVLVLGHQVHVRRGGFSAEVALEPGTNIIDVLAGAPRSRDAMSAVRVVRLVYITV